MLRLRYFGVSLIVLAAAAVSLGGFYAISAKAQAQAQAGTMSPTFIASQAAAGKALYDQQCATCHGTSLDNGEFAPPLTGEEFLQKWGGRRADELFDFVSNMMPLAAPGSLTSEQTTDLLAYLLQRNSVSPSDQPLPSDIDTLKRMILPSPTNGSVGGLAAGIVLPPPPIAVPNPLDHITPVSEAMLRNPAPGEWLTWRRTPDDQGFSPLRQINKSNVGRMELAWSWALPSGPNEGAPLVHDGVMFVYGYGDVVQALNAANGDLLWQYTRRLPKGVQATYKKSLALLGNEVFVGTADMHLVALDVKTGEVKWDTPVVADPKGFTIHGGPVVTKDRVIIGTGGGAPGGNYIVGLDPETGKEIWRFRTIPEPGDVGGDSWNGIPVDKLSGSSVWNPGSYDPETNLVFFGPSPTYNTAPLRDRVADPKYNNDALFTNCTVALDPETGKLVWYYSHIPNDQWDLDWAFERQIFNMNMNGKVTRVVVTAGKEAIFDVLEAKTGKYLFSMDLGIQNVVSAIDPKTGFKTIDRQNIVPGDGRSKFICPHAEGGKNWIPDAYNPNSKLLFVPLVESCMNLEPVAPGERGILTTGVRLALLPRPGSDGNYGRLEAINLETRKSVWVHRQRATSSTGAIATAGGLVFAGYNDRGFAAYDDATGKELWRTRLTDVPSNSISYAVNGKQYIAVITGNVGNHARLFARLVPEIKNPANRSSSVMVFEVPDAGTKELAAK